MLDSSTKLSPMMLQWFDCKQKCPHAILLFRLGDFYEAFEDDAVIAAQALELTLTKRQETAMCGVPAHAVDGYIDKLLSKGFCVAIAEQVEDPKAVKGLVKREVVKILSPGSLIQSSLLEEKKSNYLLSIAHINAVFGLATVDLSTGDFTVSEIESAHDLLDEIAKIAPKEILLSQKTKDDLEKIGEAPLETFEALITIKPSSLFEHEKAFRSLVEHFAVQSLDGFGLKALIGAINAAGALITYLKEHLLCPASHIRTLRYMPLDSFLALDKATTRHLELFASPDGGTSLIEYLDKTRTPMGARLLRKWLAYPLLGIEPIRARQDAVANFLEHPTLCNNISSSLHAVRDIERLATKLQTGTISPRDLSALAKSLKMTKDLHRHLREATALQLKNIQEHLADFSTEAEQTLSALTDTPPLKLADGGTFRPGFDQELDDYYRFKEKSHQWIAEYQSRLKEETQIKKIKIGFNRAFGYYIEVSKAYADKIPLTAERRQTLVTGDRFVTTELKVYEEKVFSLEEKIISREAALFEKLVRLWKTRMTEMMTTAQEIGTLDVLLSFAHLATLEHLTRPQFESSDVLYIEQGRHPIVEKALPPGQFVSNDLTLSSESQIYLITGPNMGGKSTFIRQVAILVIMAQIGSFVPASKIHLGIVDKVFTRIGASDNLARGQSTFMVEMGETANILNHATSQSLIILDEIGRGTSTYDGIAIASSVVEFIASHVKCKTLFATHYGELTDLEQKIPTIKNLHVAVKDTGKDIVFLHKIQQGSADRSYGIHVAKIAGMPLKVIKRAEEVLLSLEKTPMAPPPSKTPKKQLELFSLDPHLDPHKEQEDQVLASIKSLDLNNTTPLAALELLARCQKMLS